MTDTAQVPRRVLLVKTSSMGDIVHALPVVADIHAAMPGARVDWLVEEAYAPLLRAHPGIDRIVTVALRRWRRRPLAADTRHEWRALVAQLHRSGDVVDTFRDMGGIY